MSRGHSVRKRKAASGKLDANGTHSHGVAKIDGQKPRSHSRRIAAQLEVCPLLRPMCQTKAATVGKANRTFVPESRGCRETLNCRIGECGCNHHGHSFCRITEPPEPLQEKPAAIHRVRVGPGVSHRADHLVGLQQLDSEEVPASPCVRLLDDGIPKCRFTLLTRSGQP